MINSGYKSLIIHDPFLVICLFTTTIWKRARARSMGRKKGFGLAGMAWDTWDGAGGKWHLLGWLPFTYPFVLLPRLKCSFWPMLCATPSRCTGSPSTALRSSSRSTPQTHPGTGRWWPWSPRMIGTTTSPSECVRRRVCERHTPGQPGSRAKVCGQLLSSGLGLLVS